MTNVFDTLNQQLNDSNIYFHTLKMNQKTIISKGMQQQSTKNLGIYESIKITSLLDNKVGKMVRLVSVDPKSQNSFLTQQGSQFLNNHPTEQIAFVFVAGNSKTGKSFFCDKILNLAQVKGNHFCRNKEPGLYVWSAPFVKDDLSIFLVEIAGCGINSPEFTILSMYALMTGSAFVVLQDLKNNGKTSLQKLDQVLQQTVDKATSNLEEEGKVRNKRPIFMPSIFYYLNRSQQNKSIQNLSVIQFYIQKYLPDAKAKGFNGDSSQLVHLPFLDSSVISEQYMKQISQIFGEIYQKTTQKKYNDLILNGSIIHKIVKEIQKYLNNKYQINIQNLYQKLIQDLYLSGYNYCILAYHQEMEKQFQDQQPKSYDQLIEIFENVSNDILERFNQFNLDQGLHQRYLVKLKSHIDDKEEMLMSVNKSKTKNQIHSLFQSSRLHQYHDITDKIKKIQPHLTHGRGDIVAQMVLSFWKENHLGNNADKRARQEARRLAQVIAQKKDLMEKVKKFKRLQEYLQGMKDNMDHMKSSHAKVDIKSLHQQQKQVEAQIAKNEEEIKRLKADKSKHKDQSVIENKILDVQKKIQILEKLLAQLKENNAANAEVEANENNKKKKKQAQSPSQ